MADNKIIPKNKFRISSALKTIIGRELIIDEFVAVFELVKNAFDARANNVEIRFEALDTDTPRLIIKDDGKGMTSSDIEQKWLFVAYSAKREGTEENPADYRNKIVPQRIFAGAKGIGRFSCDRLGSQLNLYTRVKSSAICEYLKVNWNDFEEDSSKEFVDIPVLRSTLTTIPHNLSHGTVLEISGLREPWDRERLKDLRNSLRKLINPNQENGVRDFIIKLIVPTEEDADKNEQNEYDRVNGPIKNFLFEQLGLKTTQIHAKVDSKGEIITTTLTDRGTLIYRIVEKNEKYEHLRNIEIHLFALNRSAKFLFHKTMGVHNVAYGSVFLYKNGFRLHPIGDEGDDGLGIDRRKQQGFSRFLGTRDLSGRIEILANDEKFKEVSSRDGGFIDSPEWNELLELFYDYALKRLEKYAIDTIKWGNPLKGTEEDGELLPSDVKSQILDIINSLTRSDNIIAIDYDRDLLSILAERQSKSVTTALTRFKQIAIRSSDEGLRRDIERTERQVKQLADAKDQAETEAQRAKQAKALTAKQLETEKRKNLFLLASARAPDDQRLALEHWIKVSTQHMGGIISDLMDAVKRDNIRKEQLLDSLSQLQRWIQQTINASRFATHADFNLKANKIRKDLARFVFEYLTSDIVVKGNLKLDVRYDQKEFIKLFPPMAVTVIMDNIIDNARKAKAKHMKIDINSTSTKLLISMSNDGESLPRSLVASLFELGISGRGGSGIGLYSCQSIINDMGGEIEFTGNDPELGGANFNITLYS